MSISFSCWKKLSLRFAVSISILLDSLSNVPIFFLQNHQYFQLQALPDE